MGVNSLVLIFLLCLITFSSAYVQSSSSYNAVTKSFLSGTMASSKKAVNVKNLKEDIQSKIERTQRGLSGTFSEKQSIERLIQNLEEECTIQEPARSTLMGGKWIVDYTTAPPPSNGKLGPFVGVARQIIDLDLCTYVNYLSVPGDIEKEWLSARLEASFQEWDGVLLETNVEVLTDSSEIEAYDQTSSSSLKKMDTFESFLKAFDVFSKKKTKIDYGANCWRVDFETLEIQIFGFPILKKRFDEGTSRVWKMTYLDHETRVGEYYILVVPFTKDQSLYYCSFNFFVIYIYP